MQDAEFFTSTDAGYGGPSSNMGICAWTNLSNLPAAPTVTCQNVNLGASYTDPLPSASQVDRTTSILALA